MISEIKLIRIYKEKETIAYIMLEVDDLGFINKKKQAIVFSDKKNYVDLAKYIKSYYQRIIKIEHVLQNIYMFLYSRNINDFKYLIIDIERDKDKQKISKELNEIKLKRRVNIRTYGNRKYYFWKIRTKKSH